MGQKKIGGLWHKERVYRIVNDDISDLNQVKDISAMEILADTLPDRTGSPLSIKNLSEDLEVHHATVKKWIQILDNLYYSFRIPPYGAPKIRAVPKRTKTFIYGTGVL